MSDADMPSTTTLAGTGAASNAAAITDLLGDPSVQTDQSGKAKDQRRGQWVWLMLIILIVVSGVFLFPRI